MSAPRQLHGSRLVAVLIVLLPPLAAGLESPATRAPLIRGVVRDARSGSPLAAVVQLLDSNGDVLRTTRCDSLGRFSLPTDPGVYGVRAERDGYRPEERGGIGLWPGDTVDIELRLAPEPRSDAAAAGEPLIVGTLIDHATDRTIQAGTVHLLEEPLSAVASTLTGEDGTFRLAAPHEGTYRLRGEALGYETADSELLDLLPGDTVRVEFRLAAEAVVLDPLTVIARSIPAEDRAGLVGMEHFFHRYARYAGTPFAEFMIRDSLAQWEGRVHTTGHMLQWTIRAVRGVDPVSGEVTLRGGCDPTYYLNGSRVPFETVRSLSPELLEGVEVYLPPAIPAELGHGAPCGVVSLWSRQSPPDRPTGSPILRTLSTLTIVIGVLVLLGSTIIG